MLLQPFQFTQSKLQDYLACPRRFELRYGRRMSWPAVETAPVQKAEHRMQLGSDFHRLAHQHALALPVDALTASTGHNRELAAMWRNYLEHRPPELAQAGVQLYPETTLSTVLNGYRLVAKYDLLALFPDTPPRVLIVDWKTNLRRPPSRILRTNAQTRVYPFVLAMSGGTMTRGQGDKETISPAHLPTCSLSPNQIIFQYWFVTAPAKPEIIFYSQANFEEDKSYLADLIQEIVAAEDFPLTPNGKACRFCVYRSFCDRGDVAGDVDEFEDDLLLDEFDLDWEQVAEIAY